jgi:hypothetical protein
MFDSQIFGRQSENLFGNTIQSAVAPPRNPNCSVPPNSSAGPARLLSVARASGCLCLPMLGETGLLFPRKKFDFRQKHHTTQPTAVLTRARAMPAKPIYSLRAVLLRKCN